MVWNFKNLLDKSQFAFLLQIISQNYVVWNKWRATKISDFERLQIISQNYVVWNRQIRHSIAPSPCVANYITKLRGLKPASNRRFIVRYMLQIISQNYVVWNRRRVRSSTAKICVANYITKLRGLKPPLGAIPSIGALSCKLYHKTTWFETFQARALYCKQAPLQIISQNYVVWNSNSAQIPPIFSKLQIISQNYVVWNPKSRAH